ncbi:chromate efflux transporter [Phycobacter azelaicus]|uniref:chromate efflux transporter n=1 Tax=Phycobacter azelaicus TaxID=2668075 RepID=UPI0018686EDE
MSTGCHSTRPTTRDLAIAFSRIGLISFGGPAAQIALMHRELVEERAWLSEDEYLRGLSFCMLLPGPEAMQLCTYTGWRLRGLWGGILAGLLFVLPGALVIALLAWGYLAYGSLPAVQSAFAGIKAAVIVIVLQALWRLRGKALKTPVDWALSGFGFCALFFLGLPFPVVVLTAGLAGLLLRPTGPVSFPSGAPKTEPKQTVKTVLFWGVLWLAPLVTLGLFQYEFLAAIGWFFAKLAVVTFGGAYAVLAYMTQTVVQDHGWISTGQMIDALGLAETTPGPLILVTQFVAMLAGYAQGGFGLFVAAGAVALWATFVPCFLWIFAAAPFVERIAQHPRLGNALKAITCAVTGVILNLSLWFLFHVLFHKVSKSEVGPFLLALPQWDSIDPKAVGLTVTATIAAFMLKGRLAFLLGLMASVGLLVFAFGFST